MKPLVLIIYTVVSGPHEGERIGVFDKCTPAVLEADLEALAEDGLHAMAQCYLYGNGPTTSPRPVARPTETDE